jgi:ribA/ribD-fused uncharacterized protein
MTAVTANTNEKFFENDNGVYFKSGYPSQWYESEFEIDSRKFANCEQWMMYMKAVTFNDSEIAEEVMNTTDPKEIKALGRKGIWWLMTSSFKETLPSSRKIPS